MAIVFVEKEIFQWQGSMIKPYVNKMARTKSKTETSNYGKLVSVPKDFFFLLKIPNWDYSMNVEHLTV